MLKKGLFSFLANWNPIYLIGAWVLLIFLQAYLTPIHYDEAYYWMYSKDLAWGYFDHPPFVALLIFLSDIAFEGIFSVRFFTILCHIFSTIIIYKTIDFPNIIEDKYNKTSLFICLLIVLPLMHVFSFVTTPDAPLILSVALFFYLYKQILLHDKLSHYLLLGISIAMMFYAKYHGVLVVLFTLISNIQIIKNPKIYATILISFLLFFPHILWQIEYDYASINYHLSERVNTFDWSYPIEYLLNLTVVFNPFLLLILFAIISNKWKNYFQKSLYFTLLGFILFFFYQSFKVRIQPQWLIACYVPYIILIIERWTRKSEKYLNWALSLSIPFLVVLHLMMTFDIVGRDLGIFRNEEYTNQIYHDSKGKPVIFKNSYRRASLYSWYQGQEYTPSYNSSSGRKNQFDIWLNDSIYFDKEVYFVGMYFPVSDPIYYEDGEFYGNTIIYKPSDKLKVKPTYYEVVGDSLVIYASLINPYDQSISFDDNYRIGIKLLEKNKNSMIEVDIEDILLLPQSKNPIIVKINLDEIKTTDKIGLTASHIDLPFGAIYKFIEIEL